jgi:indole-3-glycerol phosphate synthase
MSILNEIYEYKIEFVEKQKKLHTQNDIIDKINNLPSHNFSFSKKLKNEKSRTSIIGEIKRASPSLGNFVNKERNLSNIAKTYEECGISCLSILTDEKYFKGSVTDLIDIRKISTLPILRKDFIVDEYQIYESKLVGANCILIILAMIDQKKADELEAIAQNIGLDVIIEIHNKEELQRAANMKSELIGINNRNLNNFETRLETTIELSNYIGNLNKIFISESGFHSHSNVNKIISLTGINNFLIGEYLMKSGQLESDIANILN